MANEKFFSDGIGQLLRFDDVDHIFSATTQGVRNSVSIGESRGGGRAWRGGLICPPAKPFATAAEPRTSIARGGARPCHPSPPDGSFGRLPPFYS